MLVTPSFDPACLCQRQRIKGDRNLRALKLGFKSWGMSNVPADTTISRMAEAEPLAVCIAFGGFP